MLVVAISGLGVAAFHPEGARYANHASGSRRGTGMSFFSVGGNVGFALGPIFVTPLVLVFGLSGTLALVVLPAIVVRASSSGRSRGCTRWRGPPSGAPRRAPISPRTTGTPSRVSEA